MYGIEADVESEENDKKKKKYNYEDYRKDMNMFLKVYGDKYNLKSKKFFKNK